MSSGPGSTARRLHQERAAKIQTLDLFKKPYIQEVYGVRAGTVRHPYDRRLFRSYPVFPLFVLDTGAFLFCQDHFGSADGDALLRAVQDRSLFAPWTHKGEFDWDFQHKQGRRSSLRNLVEKQAWIHRLYFLLPVAQRYLLTGDEAWARLWYNRFADWERKHPFEEKEYANFYKESDLVWFDMQVCWRSLVLIHSAYLLAGSKTFTRARWKRLYAAIEFGCGRLLTEAVKALSAGHGRGNHFLQKGSALLYAGICFPEFGRSAEFIETGKTVIRKMMAEEIDGDGGSVEDSPSYSHFIARQYVDAYLLMARNGVAGIEGLHDCIQKQYAWLRQMASPSRRTLQFNDACAMDADKDLEIVGRLLPLKAVKPRKSILLRTSQVGKIGNGRFDIFFDAMPHRNFWHDHHGRPNIVIYCEGVPLVVDTGCPNYDRFLRETYMTRSWAHNVLHIHEKPEYNFGEEWRQPFPEVTLSRFSAGRDRASVTFVHRFRWDEHRLDYTWTRALRLEKRSVHILDRVESTRAITATQRFHLAPLNLALAEDRKQATVSFNGRDIRFEQAEGTTAGLFELEYKPAYDQRNQLAYTPCIRCTARGTVMAWNVRIVL